jgi:uncharacterized membrane protein
MALTISGVFLVVAAILTFWHAAKPNQILLWIPVLLIIAVMAMTLFGIPAK